MLITRLFQSLRLGVHSLLLHKLRSGLAVIGISIGIVAVIWLVALGDGVSYQAQQQIKDLGANNIIARSVKPAQQSSSGGRGMFMEYGITRPDFKRIMSNIPAIEQAVPMREIRKEVRSEERTMDARVVGCTAEYFDMNHLMLGRGRLLNDPDNDPPQNVCVLAADVSQALFPLENPIGRSIQIEKDFYVVVGETLARDPSAAIGGSLSAQEYNADVYIPLETLRWRIGDMVFTSRSGSREGEIVQLSQVTVSVADIEQVDETADIIKSLMEKYHPNADFAVVVPKELLRQAKLLQVMFNFLLAIIAGISLIVGGIGIMNIMLATVTERTREIGVRRALGATRFDVIYQFLVEAVVLTGVGGLIGVGLGFLCDPAVYTAKVAARKFMSSEVLAAVPDTIMELEPRVSMLSVVASLIISMLVGVVFGLYPAYRAAMMDPIEALRHE